jgi:hypothetical protein
LICCATSRQERYASDDEEKLGAHCRQRNQLTTGDEAKESPGEIGLTTDSQISRFVLR